MSRLEGDENRLVWEPSERKGGCSLLLSEMGWLGRWRGAVA